MKTVRLRVLDFVRSHKIVTVGEISSALKMTSANARHHLDILRNEGLIEVSGIRKPRGKGRPSHTFRISKQTLGNNLDRLASALLQEVNHFPGYDTQSQNMSTVALRMLSQNNTQRDQEYEGSGSISKTKKLYLAVQLLNKWNYIARWEARAKSPIIILGNCPYSAIIAEHPELCELDGNLLSEMLDSNVYQQSKLALDSRGAPYCAFRINP
jgi:predicted ArsR family transcriptional regulator